MNLCIVTYSFEQGRRFCQAQGLNFRRTTLISTDANWMIPRELKLHDDDMVVKYGPYHEGRNVRRIMDYLEAAKLGNPIVYDAYMYDEHIPWPAPIMNNFGVSNERR